MSGLLKMQFRRTFRSINIYILPFVLLTFSVINVFVSEKNTETGYLTDALWDAIYIFPLLVLAACCILVVKWREEIKKGFIKNIAGNIKRREYITISRFLTGVAVIVFYSVISLIVMIFDNIVSKKNFQFRGEGLWDMVAEYLMWIFIGVVLLALILMIFEFVRSGSPCYIIAVAITTGIIEEIIRTFWALIIKNDEISRYLLISQMSYYGENARELGIEGMPIWVFWLKNAIYLIILLGTAMYTARKKDVV